MVLFVFEASDAPLVVFVLAVPFSASSSGSSIFYLYDNDTEINSPNPPSKVMEAAPLHLVTISPPYDQLDTALCEMVIIPQPSSAFTASMHQELGELR